MNYLIELKAFSEFTATNRIPANAQALWYKLMEYNNKFNWNPMFKISNARLCDDLDLKVNQLLRARKVLIDHGLINYKKGTYPTECGTYSFNALADRVSFYVE